MASGEVAKLWVFLGLRTDLSNSVAKEITAMNRQLGGVRKVADTLVSAGKTLSIGVTLPIALAAKEFGSLAANAIETENLFNVSVGSMKAQFTSFVNETSKGLGINKYDLMQTAGMYNVMLTSMGFAENQAYSMSTAMSQLAYDMASFYNLDIQEAITKLQSGLAGEVEPMRRLGIMVDENTVKTYAYANGIAKQGEELTANEKVLARYGVIMQATSKAQGDLARTADSPANAMRRMQQQFAQAGAELGKVFIPAVAGVSSGLAKMVSGLANANAATKGFITGIAGFLAVLGPLTLVIGLWQKGLTTLAPALKGIATAIGISQNAMLGWLGIIGLAVGAVMAIVTAVRAHNEQVAQAAQAEKDLSVQLKNVRDQLSSQNTDAQTRNMLLEQEKTILDQLSTVLPETVGVRDAEGKLIAISTEALDAYNKKLLEEQIAQNLAAQAAAQHRKEVLELQRAQAWDQANREAQMNAAPIDPNTLAILQSYDEDIKACDADIAKLKRTHEGLAKTIDGKGTKTGGNGTGGGGTVVSAMDSLRTEFQLIAVEGEVLRKQLGIVDDTMEAARFDAAQLSREMEAQNKIVAQAATEYNALGKAKGYANSATREALLVLKQEQSKLEDMRKQLEAEQNEQYGSPFNPGANVLDTMRNAVYGSMEAYNQAVANRSRSMGVDLSVAGAMEDAEATKKWQAGGYQHSITINNNISGVEDPVTVDRAARKGTDKALKIAASIG